MQSSDVQLDHLLLRSPIMTMKRSWFGPLCLLSVTCSSSHNASPDAGPATRLDAGPVDCEEAEICSCNATTSWLTGRNYPVGDRMEALYVADFNEDGLADIAATNRFGDDVSVLLGLADGGFSSETRFPTGVRPLSVAGGDFDEDGHLDLISANVGSGDLSLLHGNGDGSFAPENRIATSQGGTKSVVTGDFNNDAHVDFAVAGGGIVSLFWGDGTSNFSSGLVLTVGVNVEQIAAADLDNNGELDLVTVNNSSGDLSILLCFDGVFSTENRVSVGVDPKRLSINDLDNDGDLDIVVTRRDGASVELLFGTGDGGVGAPQYLSTGPAPESLAVADFNGDGNVDIAVSAGGVSGQRTVVDLFWGASTREFPSAEILPTGGLAIESLFAADMNNDNRTDLLTGMPALLGVYDSTAIHDLIERPRLATGATPGPTVIVDLDNDDALDMVVGNVSSMDLSVFWGRTDGTFSPEERRDLSVRPDSLIVFDLDKNGFEDIIIGNGGEGLVLVSNQGARTFLDTNIIIDAGTSPKSVAVADVNSDAKTDLVVANAGGDSSYLSVIIGQDNNVFAPPERIYLPQRPKAVRIADWNGDGKPDVLANTVTGLCLLLGSGDGSFSTPLCVEHGGLHVDLCLADFNDDDLVDVASITRQLDSSSAVYVHFGNESEQLGEALYLPLDAKPIGLACADVDGNEADDIIVTSASGSQAQIWFAESDKSFPKQTRFSLDEEAGQLSVADLNHDCRLDLVVSLPRLDQVQIITSGGP